MATTATVDRLQAAAFRFRGGVWALTFPIGWLLARPTPALLAAMVALVLAGQALRFWAAGYIRAYRGETLAAPVLAQDGPYALVRNPLYLGNGLIGLGLSLSSGPAVIGLFLVVFVLLYAILIVPHEEKFLSAALGESYERYRQETRRWVPVLWPTKRLAMNHFDWRAAWRGEVHSARMHAVCTLLVAAKALWPRLGW